MNVNSNDPLFYPCSVVVNKCSGSCNDRYAKLCVLDVVKNMNIKVFNLLSKTNEMRYLSRDYVSNDRHSWNSDKFRYECKELTDKGKCGDGFIWNPRACECECDKSCNVGEYLDYVKCKYRKRLIDKLIEKCDKDIDGNEVVYNVTFCEYRRVCSSSARYVVLLIIAFLIIMGIRAACFNCYWY